MSFILDALKKSENERARQNGPALLEARVMPPRRGVPLWAVVVGVVLVANLALLAWVLLRTPTRVAPPSAATPAAAAPPAAAPTPTPPPPAASTAPPIIIAPAAPATTPSTSPAQTVSPPPQYAATEPPPSAAIVNPADYAPARPAGTLPRPSAPPRWMGNDGAALDPSLPTASDLTASGSGLPALRLALHAYDAEPLNRYVLINSQRMHEGETTNEGARVELIAPEGVLMSWRGQRFRLLPGE